MHTLINLIATVSWWSTHIYYDKYGNRMVFISTCRRASRVKIMVIITIVAQIAELQQSEWEFSWQKMNSQTQLLKKHKTIKGIYIKTSQAYSFQPKQNHQWERENQKREEEKRKKPSCTNKKLCYLSTVGQMNMCTKCCLMNWLHGL